jgi:hypothetical protein
VEGGMARGLVRGCDVRLQFIAENSTSTSANGEVNASNPSQPTSDYFSGHTYDFPQPSTSQTYDFPQSSTLQTYDFPQSSTIPHDANNADNTFNSDVYGAGHDAGANKFDDNNDSYSHSNTFSLPNNDDYTPYSDTLDSTSGHFDDISSDVNPHNYESTIQPNTSLQSPDKNNLGEKSEHKPTNQFNYPQKIFKAAPPPPNNLRTDTDKYFSDTYYFDTSIVCVLLFIIIFIFYFSRLEKKDLLIKIVLGWCSNLYAEFTWFVSNSTLNKPHLTIYFERFWYHLW